MKYFFILFTLIFSTNIKSDYLDYIYQDQNPSLNSFGQTGLIQTPSAETKGEGSVFFTYNKNNIWKIGTLTVSPYDWMEASYFYYRPTDLYFGNLRGKFLDKGFNVKFVLNTKNPNIPKFAIGLDDFAGTGIFSREYMVLTQKFKNLKFTAGLGWGKYESNDSFENPLKFIKNDLKIRPEPEAGDGQGGLPSYNTWFKGPASYIAGVEVNIPFSYGLKAKLEYDPFDDTNFSVYENSNLKFAPNLDRVKESNFNFGLSFPFNKNLTFDISYIKGNIINFSFNFGGRFDKDYEKKEKFKPKIDKKITNNKNEFYISLLRNINNNNIFLQTAHIDSEKSELSISVASSKYRNPIMLSSRTAHIASQINGFKFKNINVSQINTGIELHNITYKVDDVSSLDVPVAIVIRNTEIKKGTMSFKDHDFKPRLIFPSIFSGFSPAIRSHVGSPEKFAHIGLGLKHNSEIQFSRNLILTSEIGINLDDNFDKKISRPDSPYLPNVRTEVLSYLQQSNTYIDSLQLDYIWSPYDNVYSKVSAGIFEPMYAGFGGEVLYKPFSENYSLGMEIYKVKKRDYAQKFDLLDYEVITGHFIFNYYMPKLGMLANITYGKYLAEDIGYTFDLSRKNKNGFRAGIFFSNTDVSQLEFGEGSFDKGFYFQIPFDFFSKSYSGNYLNFKMRPLTRDGAAKVEVGNDLTGLIFNASQTEIGNGWNGFFD